MKLTEDQVAEAYKWADRFMREHIRVVVVSMAQVAAEPGLPLSAEYWADRLPDESYPAYRRRKAIDAELTKAERALLRAKENLARAIALAEQ